MLTATLMTPRGPVTATVDDDVLLGLSLPDARARTVRCRPSAVPASPLLRRLQQQLAAYFENAAAGFDMPLRLRGSAFQRRVWRALQTIPAGEVRTYGELARQLGTAPRAVGAACRSNPVPLIVPCHRVIARTGLGGFAGKRAGPELALKRWLLEHEGVQLDADS
jgi:methylated-DNA-[protein]-cysteine S-methyltransferase